MNTTRDEDRTDWSGQACARGGSCHGQQWTVREPSPPALMELHGPAGFVLYRLLRSPETHEFHVNEDNHCIYVPVNGPPPGRTVIPFPERHP